MIPPFESRGSLPPGIHLATLDEIFARFGSTTHRLRLLEGFQAAVETLRSAGCRRVYLNGSFVTSKTRPNDFDALWDTDGVDLERLLEREPCFADFSNGRAAQKARFGGEFFPANFREPSLGGTFLEFFQTDRESGLPKGVVAIDL